MSLWTAVFSAVSCLSLSLVDTSATLLLTSHPPGERSQSVPFNHPARRKLSDHPRGVLVWTSAVMTVRSAELSPWEGSVYKGAVRTWCVGSRNSTVEEHTLPEEAPPSRELIGTLGCPSQHSVLNLCYRFHGKESLKFQQELFPSEIGIGSENGKVYDWKGDAREKGFIVHEKPEQRELDCGSSGRGFKSRRSPSL